MNRWKSILDKDASKKNYRCVFRNLFKGIEIKKLKYCDHLKINTNHLK